jgi:hypothetical protein
VKLSAAATVAICLSLTGCVTERIIERPVPIQPPSLCLTDCPVPEGVPETNGALLESWQAHREAVACFRARQQCIREMVTAPPAR